MHHRLCAQVAGVILSTFVCANVGAQTDTDGDGVSDTDEATLGTDPNVADDTDNDGVFDFFEDDADGDGVSDEW